LPAERAGRPASEAAEAGATQAFRPGHAVHAFVTGLLELALASVCLGAALELAGRSAAAQTSLLAAAVLWLALAMRDLARSWLRTSVYSAELDADGVTVRGLGGPRRWRWDQLSGVEVTKGATMLVTTDGARHRVRAVRGQAQGARFRAAVLARAAARGPGGPGSLPSGPTPGAVEADPREPDP
jgi:hypothetical protein